MADIQVIDAADATTLQGFDAAMTWMSAMIYMCMEPKPEEPACKTWLFPRLRA